MPAMQMPVTTRNAGAASDAGSTASSSALATAPVHADAAKRLRGSMRSGSPRRALARQPMTNPAWTPLVSAAWAKPDKWNSATSAGMTADAENHSAIAATWQSAMIEIDAALDVAGDNCVSLKGPGSISARFRSRCPCRDIEPGTLNLRQPNALLPLLLAAAALVRHFANLVR